MGILQQIQDEQVWREFLTYKIENHHLSGREQRTLEQFIDSRAWMPLTAAMRQPDFIPPLPVKKFINKGGSGKKRIVYIYPEEFNIVLKLIAFLLYKYDGIFEDNCYAFRRRYGVKDAIGRLRRMKEIDQKYCLKVDISNYFNSIDVNRLLGKMQFLMEDDGDLFDLFRKMLLAGQAVYDGQIVTEQRGAMAGTPTSPFWANVYLMNLDTYYKVTGVSYFRYSDDMLLFADSMEALQCEKDRLFGRLNMLGLSVNPSKVHVNLPGEGWEFLGFAYAAGRIDLSQNTIRKMKGKIKRKSHALRRWQRRKGLDGGKAARGFIRAMNHKFYDSGDGTDFCWSRWFFPNLTTDKGLKILDAYMQQYIRYTVTGRHYKGNYRITYAQMKEWGYRSLVHEFYGCIREKVMLYSQ